MQAPPTRVDRRRLAGIDRQFAVRLAAIAALGLAARLVYVLALTPHLRGHGDSDYYHRLANLIADGRGFVDPGNGTPTALHPPLFPLVLALASKLGASSYLAHRVVVCLLGAGAILAIGFAARRVAGNRAGLIAAALAAAYPVLISSDGAVMSETLLGLFVALAVLAAYAMWDRPTLPHAAALGVAVGLAGLTRGEGVFLLALLVLPACLRLDRRRLATLAVACAACVVVIAPWSIRNATTFDRFVPIATNEGNLLAGANCRDTYFGRDIGSWQITCVPPGPVVDESVAAARFRHAGLTYARHHASRWPLVVPARVARTFELLQPIRQARHAEGRATGIEIAGAFSFYLVAVLAVYGAIVLRRRRRSLVVLAGAIGLALLASVIGYGVPRFRQPADVAIVVLAAVAIDALLRAQPRGAAVGATGAGSTTASPRAASTPLSRTSRFSRSAGRSTR